MATARLDTCEVIDDVMRCQEVVTELLQQRLVAVDAEGINLGKTGPMALIQVAMETGHVYLFDLYRHGNPTPEMFSEGRLQDLLESESVLKVMHGGSTDGMALHFQYDVTLKNVYDVQVAQQALDEAGGRQLPQKRKLLEVCKLYLSDTSALNDKDEVQATWYLADAEFWARRPFTQEMKDYACADVRLLVPDVYDQQRQLVREKDLEAEVQRRVQDELRSGWDDEVQEALRAGEKEKVHDVIGKIENRNPPIEDLAALQDEDELIAIDRVRDNDLDKFSSVIRGLKLQHYRKKLEEIRESLMDDGANALASKGHYILLTRLRSHADGSIQQESMDLLRRIEILGVQRMASKYRVDTPLKHVSDQDKKMLGFIRPGQEHYDPIVSRLHWLGKEEYVGQLMEKLRSDREAFTASYRPGQENYFKFLTKAEIVPDNLKVKARELMSMLGEAGLLQSRQTAPRGRRPRRH